MKWTPNNDQLGCLAYVRLLTAVLNSRFNNNIAKDGEVPTARAISERIGKIRNAVKNSGAGSAPSTPRKRKSSEAPRTPIAKVRRSGQGGDKSESVAVRSKRLAANAETREENEREDLSA
ncbi:hypothetical protein Q9L58_005495 [Maublancomyces gigas]|uniref:Uncharacterized protein n=1 Tax=Discina gigas TaxID=1032678 RepID=A0ABR3GI04_9PEZI